MTRLAGTRPVPRDGESARLRFGTPQSHGCVRQALPDAGRLWAFAPEGTQAVVTA